jgi:hypothetical protein
MHATYHGSARPVARWVKIGHGVAAREVHSLAPLSANGPARARAGPQLQGRRGRRWPDHPCHACGEVPHGGYGEDATEVGNLFCSPRGEGTSSRQLTTTEERCGAARAHPRTRLLGLDGMSSAVQRGRCGTC